MNYKKDIASFNEKGQAHGYWEQYWGDDTLGYKGGWVNGNRVGYTEWGWGKKKFYIR